ncbi:molybdopterin molybdotransferase MoeA [Desulfonema magnum]|uniref:Molybdopterin molybdenumtransferase n=1 Tax=Desulfonema magnum TaxID=45655 RepID=A0A975GR09_9BACT|nr:gephyrin-like molybdotransferase Glp [Desulfonema magnum]QTA89533.1 Molybdopterin molybdenumtransferase [Desulfonema magnum]
MKEFFKVKSLDQVLEYASGFPHTGTEEIPLSDTLGRILAKDIVSDVDLPDFMRATMDGYAVRASSTFGASEANPAYLNIRGAVYMGQSPDFSIGPGECARISTGGMVPPGADSVIMIEHTEAMDDTTIEVFRSVAPGQHMIEIGEDFKNEEIILSRGQKLRPQETGLLAAFGKQRAEVFKKPVIGIISTGDEVVPIEKSPGSGQIRDINTHTLSALVREAGAIPLVFGIVQDDYDMLFEKCSQALSQSDMVLISGGSSVGVRDFTIEVLSALPESDILVHGISISPGKPTILAKVRNKAFWGLPGHVVSAMVVFSIVVRPFIEHICGLGHKKEIRVPALLSRNVSSAQGRADYVRVRLIEKDGVLRAEPILGKSGLLNTIIKADGLIEIGINTEGLDKDTKVFVIIL